jgi:hypothetical protein
MTDRKSITREEANRLVHEKYDSHDHSPAYDAAHEHWPEANSGGDQTVEACQYVTDRLLEEWGIEADHYTEEAFQLLHECTYEMVWAGLT